MSLCHFVTHPHTTHMFDAGTDFKLDYGSAQLFWCLEKKMFELLTHTYHARLILLHNI